MSSLHLINCYNGSPIKDINVIDIEKGGVISMVISNRELNNPYQMKIKLSPLFPYYDEIINDTAGIFGFRYETNEQNLGFLIVDKVVKDDGTLELDLKSMLHILSESYSYPDFVIGSISTDDLLSKLDNRFVFNSISPARIITIKTGIKNDYEILQAICEYAEFWAFRENKLIKTGSGEWKTEILIGNFGEDIETFYNADPVFRTECKPILLSKDLEIDNIQSTDNAQIDYIRKHFPSNIPNRLFVFGDNNQGISPNSRTELDPNYITQISDYPLQSIIKNNRVYWYILNTKAPANPIREKMIVYKSSNNEEQAGVPIINFNVSAQNLYQYGISYLQSIATKPYLSFSANTIKKLTLPGNVVKIDWTLAYLNPDGSKKILITEQGAKILNNLEEIDLGVITQ
jgi:hypothetical protein